MFYKKNIVFLLFLAIICSHNPLQCMFGRFSAYATKKLPAIAALLKQRLKRAPTVPAGHVISNVDGSQVTEHQFNKIKKDTLRPNEFPTALQNPNYNPDTDETKVIQKKLDEKYKQDMLNKQLLYQSNHTSDLEPKKTAVQWIPQTLHDLFTVKYSKNKRDEHVVNNEINKCLAENPKNLYESDSTYYQRLAQLVITPAYDKIYKYTTQNKEDIEKAVNATIAIETVQHEKDSTKVLLYRGQGSANDFNPIDCYDVGKADNQANYCRKMRSINDPIALSYGLSLFSNTKHQTGECPLEWAYPCLFEGDDIWVLDGIPVTSGDLQVMPISKKEFINPDGLWYVNPKFDYHQSVHQHRRRFHPRAKAHLEESMKDNKDIKIDGTFRPTNNRVQLHKTTEEALNGYKDLKKYQVQNAIGVTDYTKNKIKEAQDAYKKGVADRNSWMSYFTSFFRYKTKGDQK